VTEADDDARKRSTTVLSCVHGSQRGLENAAQVDHRVVDGVAGWWHFMVGVSFHATFATFAGGIVFTTAAFALFGLMNLFTLWSVLPRSWHTCVWRG
jgi:hypothetical protein